MNRVKMKKTRQNKKPVDANEIKEIQAENVDASSSQYSGCMFYNIDTAFIGDPRMMLQGVKMKGNSEIDSGEVKKQMIDYISTTTGFSPEMIERCLSSAEEFMKNNFGGMQ